MKLPVLKNLLAGATLFALGAASALVAQTLTDSPQRVEKQRADLAGAPGFEVVASIGEYKRGDGIGAHVHHGIEAAYVIQGATIQVAGKDPVMLATGTSLMNLREVRHGGFTIVGDTPLKLFTVHVVEKGQPLYDYAK